LDTSDVTKVIAGSPESNKEASVLLGEPVTHYCNKAGQQKGIKDPNKDLDEVVVGLTCDREKPAEAEEDK
jgi:hypothetical protein